MSDIWSRLFKGAPVVKKEGPIPRAANQKAVVAFLRAHQPCTLASMVEGLPAVPQTSVSAIVGNGVRTGWVTFELRKVPGARRKVKFYSEKTS
jgi:hypothetical protein